MQSNCPGDSFIDMPNAEVWSHNPIEYVLEYGLLSGTGGSSFNPNGSMTRSMLVNVLWRIAGKPECHSQNLFSDVQENAWYTTAVLWASENRIASGVGNGRFNPNGDVTREQIAVILCNFTSWRQNDVSSLENITEFSDYRAVSDWAVNAMSWAYAHQIISGQANGGTVLLNPTGKATRAEVSSILMRYMKPEYDEILRAGIINSDYVNIRSGPGTTNSVVSYANIGTDVLILLEDNGWYRIRTQKGTLGYVRCDFID